MIFPQLARFTDLALLLLRIMVGIVFLTSGWNHLHDPERRSHDIEMSKGFTIFLGLAELAGSLGVVFGIFVQPAAIGLILIIAWRPARLRSVGICVGGNASSGKESRRGESVANADVGQTHS